MPNGAHAVRLVDLEPDYEPDPTEIAIGHAMAAAAAAVGFGLLDGAQSGQLSRENIIKGGQAMSRIVDLRMSYPGTDWAIVARRAGREEIYRRCGPAPGVDVEELIGHVIAITNRVIAAVAH
jgi:hypothetical protein